MSSKEDGRSLKKATKRGLKAMRKTHVKHPVRKEARILKYGAKGFTRNIWLSTAATIVMFMTLVVLFTTVVASAILNRTAEMMRDKIDVTVYLKPNTDQNILNELSEIIMEDQNVKSVVVSTSEEEYEKFLGENEESEEIINVLDDEMKGIMLMKMQATMRIKVYNVDDLSGVKAIVNDNPLFQQYVDKEKAPTYDVNQAEIATITSWARIARTGGIILAVVFLVISVLIIFSTIRMAIFSRRDEIYMMKLVGADKRFIRGPFLVEAEICGVVAGILAATASYFGFTFMAPKLMRYGISVDEISMVLESNKLVLVYVVFIVMGAIIGRVSARLAVSKYLHKT